VKRVILGLAILASLAVSAQASAADLFGVWRNPKNSVHLDIRPCGASACGYVVSASANAQADARRGSGRELIGLQLLRDFGPVKDGWRGKVFVPDLNLTLTGSARLLDTGHLEARGCLLGSVLCKKQVWTRLTENEASAGIPAKLR
jgi:uncharacterized protein (DUF2147 family)